MDENNAPKDIKTILVTTDFSENAFTATKYAAELALSYNAQLLLITAYFIPKTGSAVMVDFADTMKADAYRDLGKVEAKLEAMYPHLNLKTEAIHHELVDAIEGIVEKQDIHLIVMGTRGQSDFAGKLLGSNTINIIKKVKHPVLAIPKDAVFGAFSRMTLVSDLSPMKTQVSFDFVRGFAEHFKNKLHILTITDSSSDKDANYDEAQKDFADKFASIPLQFDVVEHDYIVDGILKYMRENETQLLITVAKDHTIFERIFQQSVSKELLKRANMPILVLHE